MPRSPRHAYRCPVCGCVYWSAQYRTSLLRECLACLQRGRHYRVGTPQEARARRLVAEALDRAHAQEAPR